MPDPLLDLVEKTKAGDIVAAGQLIAEIQDNIYKIALKYLWNPTDAEDATQEALLRILTKISRFNGKSLFTTWAYRVAVNHFLNLKRNPTMEVNFDEFEENLERGLGVSSTAAAQIDPLLIHEAKIGCSQGMMQSLSGQQRIAFILGEILELDSHEGSQIMDVSRDSFRQLLSRARRRISDFTNKVCGVTSKTAKCRCDKQVKPAMEQGLIDRDNLQFTSIGIVEENIKIVDNIIEVSSFFRQTALINKKFNFVGEIRKLFDPMTASGTPTNPQLPSKRAAAMSRGQISRQSKTGQ